MIKYRRLLIALLGFIVLCVVGIALFSSRPIIKNPDSVQYMWIQYNPYVNQDIDNVIEVNDYDSERILDCLSRYKEHRTLSREKSYCLGDVEIKITIVLEDGMKQILLGNINYSSGGYGKFKWEISDYDKLLLELKSYIDLPVFE